MWQATTKPEWVLPDGYEQSQEMPPQGMRYARYYPAPISVTGSLAIMVTTLSRGCPHQQKGPLTRRRVFFRTPPVGHLTTINRLSYLCSKLQ